MSRYPTVIATIPAFVTGLGDLGVRIQNIRAAAQAQAGQTGGITLDKQRHKTALCDKAFEIPSAVLSYANTVKNNELAGKVSFTKTDLNRSRETICRMAALRTSTKNFGLKLQQIVPPIR